MRPGLSTHVFLPQRLHTGLLDAMLRACAPFGEPTLEIFAARHHFDYKDRSAVREISTWFRDSGARATLHQPLAADTYWSRHAAPSLNLIDPEKTRRIDAMDEVKRALEAAEQVPFQAMVVHLGMARDTWSPRSLEHSLTAIEHLKAFAHPLGVKLLLENLTNEVATPEHLLEILQTGHFDSVGVCLDAGHAHLSEGSLEAAAELLKLRIAEVHLHDNSGTRDEHLWPGTAEAGKGLELARLSGLLKLLPDATACVVEIAHELGETAESMAAKTSSVFSGLARLQERQDEVQEDKL